MKTKFFVICLIQILLPAIVLALWSDNPEENTPISTMTGSQVIPKIVSKDSITYISWFSNEGGNYDVRMQKVDYYGDILWDNNGLLISDNPSMTWLTDYDLIVDDESCPIVAFQDIRTGSNNIYAYRTSPQGEFLWGDDGIALSNNGDFEASPQIVVTDSGNTVAAWQRSPDGGNSVIMLQKISPNGDLLWGDGIVLESNVQENYSWPFLMPTDNDQVIVVWFRETGVPWAPTKHIYAQKFDSDGNPVWLADTAVYVGEGIPVYVKPELESDGDNGVFITWYDERVFGHLSCFVQHVDSNGNNLMQANGVELSMNTGQMRVSPKLSYDLESEELYAFWIEKNANQSQFGIYGQKLTPTGQRLWTNNGMAFINLSPVQIAYVDVKNAADGVSVFLDYYPFGNYQDCVIAAMAIDPNGEFMWTGNQVAVSSLQSDKLNIGAGDFINDQWIVAWEDCRSDDGDIYAQNLGIDGQIGHYYPPSITITAPEDSSWVDAPPVEIHFELENFTLDEDGYIAVFQDGNLVMEHFTPDSIIIDSLTNFENHILLRLMTMDGDPVFPLTEDEIVLYLGSIDISHNNIATPQKIDLHQNFPNPFNPSTTIGFTIPQDGTHLQGGLLLTLNIYDVSGKLIKTLVDGPLEPGYHSITWNAEDSSSGVYFYKIQTNVGFSEVRKCVILK